MRNLYVRAITLALLSLLLAAPALAWTPGYRIILSLESHSMCQGSTMDITAYVEDGGVPQSGHEIEFTVITANAGYVSPDIVYTNAEGDANTVYHPGTYAGGVTIKAVDKSHNNSYATNWISVTDTTAPVVTDGGVYTTSKTQLSASWTPTARPSTSTR